MQTSHKILGVMLMLLLVSCSYQITPEALITSTALPPDIPQTEIVPPALTLTQTSTPEVRIQKGDLALFNGDFSLAQTEYQTAFASTSDASIQAAALWGLGRVNLKAGNPGGALANFNTLIADFPDSPHRIHAHFLRGEIMFSLERYTEAVEAYSTYLILSPGVIDNYVFELRGEAYGALGDFQNAIADFQSALNGFRVVDDIELQIKLALAYESSGDSITALAMFDSIASNTPSTQIKAQMDLYSGRLHLDLGQPDVAYAHFLHSVENYPLEYESYSALVALVDAGVPVDDLSRGLVDYYAGQYGYALDAFSRYATTHPENDGTVYYYRALALRESGLYQEAVDAFSYFIDNYSYNFYWKAACEDKADTQWFYLDQYEAAADTLLIYTQLTSDISSIPLILLSVGRIYERANRLDLASAIWESIADQHPGSELVPQALFGAGIIHYRAAEYDKALLTFQRGGLFSLTPEDQARAAFWTGKTQMIIGDSAGAQSSFLQTASIDQTDYYSLRAQDILFNRSPFNLPLIYSYDIDLDAERELADSWLRITFGLPVETNLSGLDALALDLRLIRGTELWSLDHTDEASLEFEDLRAAISEDAVNTYRLGNYLLDLRLYRSAIFALRQVLTLAGMESQSETLAAPRYFNLVRYGLYYQELIVPVARSSGFDPLFILSVIRQESLFDTFAGSGQGALGLMQITPGTGQLIVDNLGWPPDYSMSDLYRPLVSISLGTDYLSDLRLRFSGEFFTALAAYNAGPNAAPIWRGLSGPDPDLFLETIRYPETHDYIRSIYEIYNFYHMLYGSTP